MNYSWTRHELFVNYLLQFVTVVALCALPRTGTHRPVQFMNSLRIVYDPVLKFCYDQNFELFKILVPTWHIVMTGLRTYHASLRLVSALARLESGQCVPHNRTSVSLAKHSIHNDYLPFSSKVTQWSECFAPVKHFDLKLHSGLNDSHQ